MGKGEGWRVEGVTGGDGRREREDGKARMPEASRTDVDRFSVF